MRVLVISGIWPPDVGGPASHAPDVAAFLQARGHAVEVLVTADKPPGPASYPVRWISRGLPAGVRHARVVAEVARRARAADVVYTTGMFTRSALGARSASRPYVVKLTGDPAFERLRWRGAVHGGVEAFQSHDGGLQAGLLRRARDTTLRHAAYVFSPSAYLRSLAVSWGVQPDRVEVLPNPAPGALPTADREELRRRHGFGRLTLVFAGRLTPQKALHQLLEALASVDAFDLVVVGEGPERAAVERGVAVRGLGSRVRLLGAQPRETVLELFAAADAAVLTSAWENFPHSVVEALATGTPVLSTEVGGVAEVVDDGVNGLLVPVGDIGALTAAMNRLAEDGTLRSRLRAEAMPSVERYAPEVLLARIEDVLERVAR